MMVMYVRALTGSFVFIFKEAFGGKVLSDCWIVSSAILVGLIRLLMVGVFLTCLLAFAASLFMISFFDEKVLDIVLSVFSPHTLSPFSLSINLQLTHFSCMITLGGLVFSYLTGHRFWVLACSRKCGRIL